jgi:hypothetical protein
LDKHKATVDHRPFSPPFTQLRSTDEEEAVVVPKVKKTQVLRDSLEDLGDAIRQSRDENRAETG